MELVEKWEQSGLLEGVKNKDGLAKTLEYAASDLLEFSAKQSDQEAVKVAASMTFPIIRRVLGERDFTFTHFLEHIGQTKSVDHQRETEFVEFTNKETLIEDEHQPQICANTAELLSVKLNKYPNLKVYGVHTEVKDNGFEVQFLCS